MIHLQTAVRGSPIGTSRLCYRLYSTGTSPEFFELRLVQLQHIEPFVPRSFLTNLCPGGPICPRLVSLSWQRENRILHVQGESLRHIVLVVGFNHLSELLVQVGRSVTGVQDKGEKKQTWHAFVHDIVSVYAIVEHCTLVGPRGAQRFGKPQCRREFTLAPTSSWSPRTLLPLVDRSRFRWGR